MTATTARARTARTEMPAERRRKPFKPTRALLYLFLTAMALGWIAPLALAFYASLRPYADTAEFGYISLPHHLSFHYYKEAWDADLLKYFRNSLIIAVPSVILVLFFASFVGFGLSRYKIPGRKTLLIMFTAGNLLPPQVMLTPLYTVYRNIPLPEWLSSSGTLYDSYLGVILIHVAFQTGFCVFVLYNYMQTIPHELSEAALVDGAGVWRQYWQVILPLTRPALGALATLEFTWIYNDFLWALVLMSTGDKYPVTSALNNLRGQFFTDYNLLAAGSVLVFLPTLVVFFLLQKQFISGLTLGANKG
jgi:multiple sugar transport system permease protein